jgi:hypothetical protein
MQRERGIREEGKRRTEKGGREVKGYRMDG